MRGYALILFIAFLFFVFAVQAFTKDPLFSDRRWSNKCAPCEEQLWQAHEQIELMQIEIDKLRHTCASSKIPQSLDGN